MLAAIAARRCGRHHWIDVSARAPTCAVLPEAFFAIRQHGGHSARGSGLPVQQRRQPPRAAIRPMGTVAPTGRAFRIPATTASRCKPRASTTTSTPRTWPGSAFSPTPDCRPLTPIRSIRSSTPISPQPLYSFASGYTHVFSAHLVNYFNPAFSWYESLFGPADFEKTLAAFPIVLEGSGANAPFTPLGGLDNTWVQGRRATRFFINDNLAWTVGSHEFRFGTNTRIFRLNDYDFGEGVVPLVTYTTLPQFIYGVASTASETFPLADSQPYNFLNLDFYAQDTWKVTRTFTWTFGIRDTYNSNPLNPHDAVARLAGSFASISHDVNQPLDQVIQTHLANVFASTPAGYPAAEDRDRLADRAAYGAAHRFRPVQRYLARQRGRYRGNQSSLLEDLSGRTAGHGGWNGYCSGSSEQRHRCHRGRESAIHLRLRAGRAFLRFAAGQSATPAFRRFRSPPFRMASSTRLTSCSGASPWNIRSAIPSICALSMWERAP